MNDLNKTLELAEISFEGENYQDSFKKFSEAVEIDLFSIKGWIGKGLSSAHLADPTGNKFKEASVCLKKATEIGISDSKKKVIAENIIKASNEFIKKCNQKVTAILLDKEKKPMATGELYAVRNLGLIADRYGAFNEQWPNYKLAIEFSFTSLNYDNSTVRKKEVLDVIDHIYTESKGHFHKDILPELSAFRNDILSQVKAEEPTYTKPEPQSNDGGGCFIATAVYGDYNAPEVIELRDFRDTFLSKYYIGNAFIKNYYKYSPHISDVVRKNNFLKKASKILIIHPTTFFWALIKKNQY